jgi:hypothetical protein
MTVPTPMKKTLIVKQSETCVRVQCSRDNSGLTNTLQA